MTDDPGVTDAIEFDPNLYPGTATFYDRFRVPYPPELMDDLVRRTRSSGHGRLLDLARGTGQVTFAIADHFAEVWAVVRGPGDLEDRDRCSYRVPADWDEPRGKRPDTAVLTSAGFEVLGFRRFPTTHAWTLDALIGYVYSTSFLPNPILGAQADELEDDLRRALADFTSRDALTQTIGFAYELARRPEWAGWPADTEPSWEISPTWWWLSPKPPDRPERRGNHFERPPRLTAGCP
jgi:hypothetical protein